MEESPRNTQFNVDIGWRSCVETDDHVSGLTLCFTTVIDPVPILFAKLITSYRLTERGQHRDTFDTG